jgi:hypothetical protein
MAADAFVLFLDEKNQKSSHPGCFFAAHGLPCKADKTKGPVLLPPSSHKSTLQAKLPMPCHHTSQMFYRLSPEAPRLTDSA